MTENFLSQLRKFSDKTAALAWKGTVAEYLEILHQNPSLNMGAHKRVLNMILSHGVERDDDGNIISYNFFKNEIFGLEEPIEEIMSYLRAAASGSEVGRRILLLFGPTSSGKSQLAVLFKRGLEEYSKTPEGAVYRLIGTPMNEDPLCAVPHELRKQVSEYIGSEIVGELSPLAQQLLEEKYDGRFLDMEVERYFFSERSRSSIGSFLPSDKKSQDISELIGSVDLSAIGTFGTESDPRAYKFNGELNVSNRGMMEFIEMLKVDQKFLYVLLTLAQEKNIKTPRFSLIWADEFILAHTNEVEYKRFLGKDEMEALHDRTIVVKVPYNLSIDNEVRIYEKLIKQANFGKVHIAPHTIRCAAIFAVLSRLKDSENQELTLLKKLKMYNGEQVEGFTKAEVGKFKKEIEDEGMIGISPRYVINRISAKLSEDNVTTITPLDVIRSLRDGMKSNPKLDKKETDRLERILLYVIEEYEKLAKNDVQKAFFVNFEHEIKNLLENYMENIEAFLDNGKIENEWGDLTEPNEKLMRSIEEKISISESGKKSFRQEIYRKMLKNGNQYQEHAALKEALEKQLFEERKDVIRLTVSSRNPDEESLRKINVVIDTLCQHYGYDIESANQLLRYVNSLMSRK